MDAQCLPLCLQTRACTSLLSWPCLHSDCLCVYVGSLGGTRPSDTGPQALHAAELSSRPACVASELAPGRPRCAPAAESHRRYLGLCNSERMASEIKAPCPNKVSCGYESITSSSLVGWSSCVTSISFAGKPSTALPSSLSLYQSSCVDS